MIVIHSTKKLWAKLPVDSKGLLPHSPERLYLEENAARTHGESPLGAWHANLLTLQRRNCILLVHDHTRFPVFIPALKKADLLNLEWWFEDVLVNTVMRCGGNESHLQAMTLHMHRMRVDTVCDRSVQGTMNQMASDLKYQLDYEGADVSEVCGYQISAWLAARPCTVKGRREFVWPEREFVSWLGRIGGETPAAGGNNAALQNVVNLADYRNHK